MDLTLPTLPQDMLCEIFAWLPQIDLVIVKFVCKTFKFISDKICASIVALKKPRSLSDICRHELYIELLHYERLDNLPFLSYICENWHPAIKNLCQKHLGDLDMWKEGLAGLTTAIIEASGNETEELSEPPELEEENKY